MDGMEREEKGRVWWGGVGYWAVNSIEMSFTIAGLFVGASFAKAFYCSILSSMLRLPKRGN
jgi:hypothetical protein